MLPGISTSCFYPLETEKALRLLADNGVAATEAFINTESELDRAYLKELRAIADGGGVRILSLHPFTSGLEPLLFFSQYERRFQDGRELYRRYYEAAAFLGAKVFVFHGGFREYPIETSEFLERICILCEDARKEGIWLCHENVTRNIGRDPEFFRQLHAAVPEARFTFDIKQAVRAGYDAFSFAKAMGTAIGHVHLSDNNETQDCLPPGKGTFDLDGFLMLLRNIEYHGGVIVELYRQNFADNAELFCGYQYLRDKIKNIAYGAI